MVFLGWWKNHGPTVPLNYPANQANHVIFQHGNAVKKTMFLMLSVSTPLQFCRFRWVFVELASHRIAEVLLGNAGISGSLVVFVVKLFRILMVKFEAILPISGMAFSIANGPFGSSLDPVHRKIRFKTTTGAEWLRSVFYGIMVAQREPCMQIL